MKKNSNNECGPTIDRAFLNIISAHKNGSAISDVSAALKQVTAAVQLTGKAGKVALIMSISPATKGDVGTLVFVPTVKSTVPETEAVGSIFYSDEDFNLVREDPDRATLPLKTVESAEEQTELKKVGAK